MDRQAMISALAELYEPREASLLINYLHQDLFGGRNQLSPDENQVLEAAFQRLLRHEPLQYITGKAYFRDLLLYVAPGVLIPRPETEELVNLALEYAQNRKISHILDIGTGSGCIALALKKKLPDVKITAIDKSEEALAIAQKNAIDLDLK
ncbi:MAG: peptide chain release factor N(5)-glutamine methyltransferase [Saprospiraceae bacterium]|nr:peptide chain release factor N(5)-glutamine methyltransferase [Saprospiraceae bacterium]